MKKIFFLIITILSTTSRMNIFVWRLLLIILMAGGFPLLPSPIGEGWGVRCFSQGTWTQKAGFDTTGRQSHVAFSIGTKGYVGTGSPLASAAPGLFGRSFWEWDQPTNAWTQKANYGGTNPNFGYQWYAAGCAIGNKGYIGTGATPNDPWSFPNSEWWEYDPAVNKWTQKANYPVQDYSAVAFSIGAKGYVGTGVMNGSAFWEYDPAADAWTQIANIGGSGRCVAVAFSIPQTGKGYVGAGLGASLLKDFWEYNPVNNTWSQIANLPVTYSSGGIFEATAFHIGKFGYVGTGTYQQGSGCISDFWRYDPSLNTWTPIAKFGGGIREMAAAFSIGCYGYVVGGFINDAGIGFTDLWEYHDPADTTCGCTLPVTAFADPASICAGAQVGIFASGANSYSWNTGSTDSHITDSPSVTTTYIVTGTNAAGCAGIATIKIDVYNCATAVAEINSASSNAVVFPSPFSESAVVALSGEEGTQQHEIKIYDLLGNEVRSINFTGKQTSIERGSLSEGVYLYHLTSPLTPSPQGEGRGEVVGKFIISFE